MVCTSPTPLATRPHALILSRSPRSATGMRPPLLAYPFSVVRPTCGNVRRGTLVSLMGDIDSAFWVRPFQIMEWSNEASLALVEEYRMQPVLWDVHHQSYSSKSQKQSAWETIASNMQLDVQEVRQKMNSLLGSFRREKSKMKKLRESSSGLGTCYFPKWFAFEKMQFLLRDDESDTLGVKFEDDEDSIFEELRYPIQESLETEAQNEVKRNSTGYVPPAKRAKKIMKPIPDPLLDDFSIFPPQDEYSAFGQYIACKIRKFDSRTRAFIEHAINNVLFEAEMGKYENASSPVGSSQPNWTESAPNIDQVASDRATASPTLNEVGNGS